MATIPSAHAPRSQGNGARGYRQAEATQFIEFCVELDNQDDRARHPADPLLRPAIDPALWNPVPLFDSRRAVATAVFAYASDPSRPADRPWARLYGETVRKASAKYAARWTAATIEADADLNGFGPWQQAWALYEGRGPFAGAYAIAIRGTVFSNTPSAVEDAWIHTVLADRFLSPVVRFAEAPAAALHSGFAHGAFTTLFDDRYGILRVLADTPVPAGAPLFLVGHSQGAAVATLVHASLYYAMRHDDAVAEPAFGLTGKRYQLKSYGFAQPKPGDTVFAADFAGITQPDDSAIVVNSTLDPVPQVPMTLQAIGDFDTAFQRGLLAQVIQDVSSVGALLHRAVGALAEPLVRRSAIGFGDFYHYPALAPLAVDVPAATRNFAPAGRVFYVRGTPGDGSDAFLQHHATTYRTLIRTQLSD